MRQTYSNDLNAKKRYFNSSKPGRKYFNNSTVKEQKPFDFGRALIAVLRHNAIKEGLTMSSDGYILCDDILKIERFSNFTNDNIKDIVDTNDKKRFALKEENNKLYIRANQGHSNDVEFAIDQTKLLKKLIKPLLIAHATTLKIYNDEIKVNGLKNPKIPHIYFEIYDEKTNMTQFKEKFRYLIHVNMQMAMDDGIEFYISENNIVLSKGSKDGIIDKKYIIKVTDRKTGEIIL